jgi:hypothetical protein
MNSYLKDDAGAPSFAEARTIRVILKWRYSYDSNPSVRQSYSCSSVRIGVQNAFLCVLRDFVVFFGCGLRLRCAYGDETPSPW